MLQALHRNVTATLLGRIYKKYNHVNFPASALYRCFLGLAPGKAGAFSGAAAALGGASFADAAPGTLGTARGAAGAAAWKGGEVDMSALGPHCCLTPLPLPPHRGSGKRGACHRLQPLVTTTLGWEVVGGWSWEGSQRPCRGHSEPIRCPEMGRGLAKVIGQ